MVRLITEEKQVAGHKAKVGKRRGTGHPPPPRRGFLYLPLLLLASFFQPFFLSAVALPLPPRLSQNLLLRIATFFGAVGTDLSFYRVPSA